MADYWVSTMAALLAGLMAGKKASLLVAQTAETRAYQMVDWMVLCLAGSLACNWVARLDAAKAEQTVDLTAESMVGQRDAMTAVLMACLTAEQWGWHLADKSADRLVAALASRKAVWTASALAVQMDGLKAGCWGARLAVVWEPGKAVRTVGSKA